VEQFLHDARGVLVVAGLVVGLRERNLHVRIARELEGTIGVVDGLWIIAQRRVQAHQALVAVEFLRLWHAGRIQRSFQLARRVGVLSQVVIRVAADLGHVVLVESGLRPRYRIGFLNLGQYFVPLARGLRFHRGLHGLRDLLADLAAAGATRALRRHGGCPARTKDTQGRYRDYQSTTN